MCKVALSHTLLLYQIAFILVPEIYCKVVFLVNVTVSYSGLLCLQERDCFI